LDIFKNLKIVVFIYDRFTALDAIGPYEVFSRIPNAEVFFVALKPGIYSDGQTLSIEVKHSLNEIEKPDVIVIPGGFGIDSLLQNREILDWIRLTHNTTQFTASVCSGALLLAAAGLLKNIKATTHWNRVEQLKKYGVEVVNKRYVHDGKIITSAGVSAGIDMALYMISKLANEKLAQIIQLSMEYDPQPPFNSGSPEKAPKEIVEILKKVIK